MGEHPNHNVGLHRNMKRTALIFQPSHLEISIFSKNGTREFTKIDPLESYLSNFMRIILTQMSGVPQSILDTGGTPRVTTEGGTFKVNAPAANSTYGLVVGTGTTPVTIQDYKLQTQILNGSGAGQLAHQISVVTAMQNGADYSQFQIQRNFINQSGSSITVKETGLYVIHQTYFYCIVRDLTGDIVVANGKTLAMQYYIKTTV